jgi:hypothetical protein
MELMRRIREEQRYKMRLEALRLRSISKEKEKKKEM